MASKDAQMDWRGTVSVSEGVSAWSKICGSLENVIEEIVTGVRSGLSYSGVESIEDLYHHSTMRRISQLSILENKPHSTGAKYT
jgi:IMP dehydrogenase